MELSIIAWPGELFALERKAMASAPEDSGFTELQQLKPGEDDDYDPFTDEGIR